MKHIYLAIVATFLVFNAKSQSATTADFENLNLGTREFYNGSDKAGGFTSGNFRFLTDYNESWNSWSGFAASVKTDFTTPGYGNQYSAITGKGVAGTPGYAVGYPVPVSTVIFQEAEVSGVYVTNSTYAYFSMKNGDAYSKKFGGQTGNDEDYFILTIEGFDTNNKSTGKVDFYLADFRNSTNSNDYILDSWKWVNLKSLGRISKLGFSLRSSDNGTWGMNTPGYFCIDNMNHEILTSSPDIQQVQTSVFPNPFSNQISISGITTSANVTISDISGRIVSETMKVSNNQSINGLENLKTGIYFIQVSEGNARFTSKLMKK
jgi:hypothetical protein